MKFISVFASLAVCGVASAVVVTQKPKPYEITEVGRVCFAGSPNNLLKATPQEIKLEFNGRVIGQGWTELDANQCAELKHTDVIEIKPNADIPVTYEIRDQGANTGISEISHKIPTSRIFPNSKVNGVYTTPVEFIVGYEVGKPARTAYTKCVDVQCASYNRPTAPAIILETKIMHASQTKPTLNYKPIKSMGFCMEPRNPQDLLKVGGSDIVMRRCTGADSQRFAIDKPTKRIEYSINNGQARCIEAITPSDPLKPTYLKLNACSTAKPQKFAIIAKGYIMSLESRSVVTIENYGVDVEATEPLVVIEKKIKPFTASAKTKPISAPFSQTWNRGINNVAVFRPLRAVNKCVSIDTPATISTSNKVVTKPCSKGELSQSWGLNSHGQFVSKFNKKYCLASSPTNKLILSLCEKPNSPTLKEQVIEFRSSIHNSFSVISIVQYDSQKYIEVEQCGNNKNIPEPTIQLNQNPQCTKPREVWK